MASDPHSKPSFSVVRKWGIGLQVFVLVVVVFSVVVMANYISRDYFRRFQVSRENKIQLSPLTASLLNSLTNQVRITLYYDKKDPVFDMVSELVQQYERQSHKHISVQVVDYLLDPGAAQKTKEQYKLGANTNIIIFDCAGTALPIAGNTLAEYDYELPPDGPIRRKFISFRGETAFTATLLAVTDPKPRTAYFLQGHGEHDINSGHDVDGYLRFAGLMALYGIQASNLNNLAVLDGVPTNCDLLVIPGPRASIPEVELKKIDQYLDRSGSRLLALLADAPNPDGGLERILAKWGVRTSRKLVLDPEHTPPGDSDVVVSAFSIHPVVSPLYRLGLDLGRPREVERLVRKTQPTDPTRVQVLAQTGVGGHFEGDDLHKAAISVMVAVEKSIPGVAADRGPTRMLVVGDSLCLANSWLASRWANHEFAVCAVMWLLDRTALIQIGPQPVNEYTFKMTKTQLQSAELILLAGMPGGVLFLGFLVWLRRRR